MHGRVILTVKAPFRDALCHALDVRVLVVTVLFHGSRKSIIFLSVHVNIFIIGIHHRGLGHESWKHHWLFRLFLLPLLLLLLLLPLL